KIPFQTKPRMFGGAGFTGVMNVTLGPVEFDTNNDDRIDVFMTCRGIPECSTERSRSSYITYIARAFWLSTDKRPTDATGALVAVWPYLPNVAQKVYDSEEDEVTWKLLLPRYIAGAAFRPGMVAYHPQVLDSSLYEVTGSLVKEHRDVYAAVFDIKMRFSYEGKPLGDIAKDLEVTFEKAYDLLTFKGKDVVDVKFLPRGTYTVIAKYKGHEVARRTLDLSAVNVGTVTADIPLAMRDVSIQVVDILGRPLVDAKVEASPPAYAGFSNVGGIVTIRGIVTTLTYEFTVSWTSATYRTDASVVIADTPDGLAARKTIELPVGTVVVSVVDRRGDPIAGATVKFGPVEKTTDSAGKAYFEQVPLETAGKGIAYDVSVVREGFTVFSGRETVSRAKTTVTVIGELFSLKVRVAGAAGQGLPFAKVVVKRAGAEIGTFTTDEGGFLEIPKLPLSDYTVEAEWKGFKGSKPATKEDLTAGRAVEIVLEPYMEIAGVPFTFSAFLGLIIGLIILVIVLVVILSEYIRWRGRRLGIYPPPPPKK
ncbi:MAG: carboxypeptidase-like regulatory domain-containing protein, partial [Nitrososphaeria archaeon]|nr:carboxypeptidase-like regulatory domain-containing protein [Nitrososphaeria archaeon]